VTELTPAVAPTPPIWVGSPRSEDAARYWLARGRMDTGAAWPIGRGSEVAESRPLVDEAAASLGRDPTDVDTIYNVTGRIGPEPLAECRDDEAVGSEVAWRSGSKN
jgi:alkanesulfonate monooxygenase SsuD/methylene tetrahydromethanopterin reductase-like flavin-dependent oxidoreductase (luciferase family)